MKEDREQVDWMDNIDAEAMGVMLEVQGDMLAITIEEPSDPSTFIMPTSGQLSNWTRVVFYNSMGKVSCNASSNVLFNIFNEMNSYLAYFDVSYNIEILHLNDSKEFENEINNNWKRNLNLENQLLKLLIWAMMRIHVY